LIAAAGASLSLPLGFVAYDYWWTLDNGAAPIRSELEMGEIREVTDAELSRDVFGTVHNTQLLNQILDGDTTTQAVEPPFYEQEKVVHRADIYELSHQILDETPAIEYDVQMETPDTDSVDEGEAIQYADLPAVDQQKIGTTGPDQGEWADFIYTDSERERSVLVPESEYSYITWESGPTAEWSVEEATDTTWNTYDYTATEVATAAEYGRQMREESVFELSGLPESEQEIVEAAISDTYYGAPYGEEVSEAFSALINRLRGHEVSARRIADSSGLFRTYIVQYQGSMYLTRLRYYDGKLPEKLR
jgi:hypothetical protein